MKAKGFVGIAITAPEVNNMCWYGCNECGKGVKPRSCGCSDLTLLKCPKCNQKKKTKSKCMVCGSKDIERRQWIDIQHSDIWDLKNGGFWFKNDRIIPEPRFAIFKNKYSFKLKSKDIFEIYCLDCENISYYYPHELEGQKLKLGDLV